MLVLDKMQGENVERAITKYSYKGRHSVERYQRPKVV